jgi:hypothetical protein
VWSGLTGSGDLITLLPPLPFASNDRTLLPKVKLCCSGDNPLKLLKLRPNGGLKGVSGWNRLGLQIIKLILKALIGGKEGISLTQEAIGHKRPLSTVLKRIEGVLRWGKGEVSDGKNPHQGNQGTDTLRPTTASACNSMSELFFLVRYRHS